MNYKHISHDERLLIIDDYKSGLTVCALISPYTCRSSKLKHLIAVWSEYFSPSAMPKDKGGCSTDMVDSNFWSATQKM
jgi:hypothetical protein